MLSLLSKNTFPNRRPYLSNSRQSTITILSNILPRKKSRDSVAVT